MGAISYILRQLTFWTLLDYFWTMCCVRLRSPDGKKFDWPCYSFFKQSRRRGYDPFFWKRILLKWNVIIEIYSSLGSHKIVSYHTSSNCLRHINAFFPSSKWVSYSVIVIPSCKYKYLDTVSLLIGSAKYVSLKVAHHSTNHRKPDF